MDKGLAKAVAPYALIFALGTVPLANYCFIKFPEDPTDHKKLVPELSRLEKARENLSDFPIEKELKVKVRHYLNDKIYETKTEITRIEASSEYNDYLQRCKTKEKERSHSYVLGSALGFVGFCGGFMALGKYYKKKYPDEFKDREESEK